MSYAKGSAIQIRADSKTRDELPFLATEAIPETLAPPPGVSCAGIEKGPHSLRPAGTSDGPRPILERLQDEAWRVTRCPAPFHPVSEASPRVSIIKSPVVVLKSLPRCHFDIAWG